VILGFWRRLREFWVGCGYGPFGFGDCLLRSISFSIKVKVIWVHDPGPVKGEKIISFLKQKKKKKKNKKIRIIRNIYCAKIMWLDSKVKVRQMSMYYRSNKYGLYGSFIS